MELLHLHEYFTAPVVLAFVVPTLAAVGAIAWFVRNHGRR